jgi:hypothetical protein
MGHSAFLIAVEADDENETQLLDVFLPRSEIDVTGASHWAVLHSRPLMVKKLLTASRQITVLGRKHWVGCIQLTSFTSGSI